MNPSILRHTGTVRDYRTEDGLNGLHVFANVASDEPDYTVRR